MRKADEEWQRGWVHGENDTAKISKNETDGILFTEENRPALFSLRGELSVSGSDDRTLVWKMWREESWWESKAPIKSTPLVFPPFIAFIMVANIIWFFLERIYFKK